MDKTKAARTFKYILLAGALLLACCTEKKDRRSSYEADHELAPSVTLLQETNGVVLPVSRQFRSEGPDHPALILLRNREGLDKVIEEGRDELARMQALCDWVNSQWEQSSPVPYPPWDANRVLEMIRSGETGGFCAQYSVVLVQSFLALGWQARYIDIAPEGKRTGSGHFTVEAWSNQLDKWFVLDPFYDCRFEKEGMPLSALEIHRALARGEEDSIDVVRGQGENAHKNSSASEETIIEQYYHISFDIRTDHLSRPFNSWDRRDGYISWKDALTDARPEIFRRISSNPLEFNFPLNQTEATLVSGNKDSEVVYVLRSNAPGLFTFEIKEGQGQWKRHPSPLNKSRDKSSPLSLALFPTTGLVVTYHWALQPGVNSIKIRSVNKKGVAGPAASFKVSYHP